MSRARQILLADAVQIDRELDNPKSARVTDLRKMRIKGTDKTYYYVLTLMVESVGMESVLHALRDIQAGRR